MTKPSLHRQQRNAIHQTDASALNTYIQPGERPWVRRVARGMVTLLLVQATVLAVPAHAQITPSANAPAGQRPIMDAAQNGVPIVHIAPPSAAGVSRNQYEQFNVNPNGLILNNSPSAVQTQQGGWITGNLQLGPVPARIILNEVVGANPSQLRGTIEVAGQRANIVVANPNGISCDGCGFLNTGRATLTTGQTQFGGDGGISGFDVRQGQVSVGSNGLNAANIEQLDLIARGIVIEGEVWARNLNVLAGANTVLYGTLQAAAQGGTGPAPQFAIDIKNLGGMYANQIYLVSSELGVGVNSTGRVAALQGNLVLSANGDLTLKDSYAKQNIQIAAAGKANLTGQTQSGGMSAITVNGDLSNQGTMDVQGALSLNGATINNSGAIVQRDAQGMTIAATGGVGNSGVIYGGGAVSIGGNALRNQGQVVSGQSVGIRATSLDNTDGQIAATGDVTIASSGALNNTRGKVQSDGTLSLGATTLNNQAGTVSAANASVRLGSGLLDNGGGQVIGNQSLTLQSGEIRNSAGTLASGAALALDTQGGTLTNNNGGQIVAGGDLTVASARFDNTGGTAASINGRLQVNTNGQQLQNDGGKLQAAGNAAISAGATSTRNGLVSGQDVTLATGTLDNSGGRVIAGGSLSTSTQALANDGGLLQSVGNAQIQTNGQALSNSNSGNSGGIVAGGTLALNAGSVNNQAGFIASSGDHTLTVTGDLDNRALNGSTGQIVGNGNSTIAAGNVLNRGGRINVLGNAGMTTGQLDNQAGAITAAGNVQLNAATIDNRAQNGTAGSIDGANITSTATSIDNRGGALRATNDVTLTANALDNSSGTATAGRNLTLSATSMANAGGRMVGDRSVTLTTSSSTLGGTIASSNDVTLNVNGDYNNNTLLSAQNDLTVNATNISNSSTMKAGRTLMANTGNLSNAGEISGQNVVLNASGTLTNSASGLIDGTDTRINAGTVNNTGRIYGDMLRINAGTVNNSGTGVIAARNTLLIGAQNLNNTNGALIYSLGDIGIGGSIDANGQLQGSAQSVVNASSKIEAAGNLSINSTNILNRNDGLTTTQVADPSVHQEKAQPNGNATQYPTSQCYGIGGGQDDNGCIVHPDKYGQRSTVLPAIGQVCVMDPNTFNQVCTPQPNYTWNDPVFARFGVTPVSSPPPAEPAGGCTTIDINTGMTVPVNSGACNQWNSDYATWNTGFQATLTALDAQITPYNAEVTEDNRIEHFEDYTWYKINSTTSRTVVATTAPGQILSGGSMNLTGSVTNRDSQIVAGSTLAIAGPAVNNLATQGETRTDFSGTTQFTEVVSCGTFGGSHCRNWYGVNPYNPAPISVMTDLATVRYEQNVGNQTVVRTLANASGSIDASTASAVTAASGSSRNAQGQLVQAGLAAGNPLNLVVPSNSLFVLHAEPGARYLVETDPRFTNFRTFLGSDYFLQSLRLDPQQQLKRYGDGFLEQQLVNDQILALTGRRYLDGYSSTEAEYKGLMDAGVAFAQKYQLTPGVALTADQMALLTTDIVWLATRTVTLADGTTQQVLAPQVYLRRPQGGDLQANGSLIAGNDVLIQSTGDLVNSGTLAGKTITVVAGKDLVNQGGRIGGQDVFLRANNDLKNLSGVIQGTGANSAVTLLAGRDIVLQTQTLGTVNNDGSSTRSSVQRIATVQGGDIQMQAGRDLTALGATVVADNTLTVLAGRDIKIAAVAGEYQLNVQDKSGRSTQGRTGYVSEAATTNQLATMKSGSDMILAANGNVSLKGANVDAGSAANGNLIIQGQNVSIEAVKDRAAFDIQTIGEKSYNRVGRDNEVMTGGSLAAGNNITVRANGAAADGNGNITLTGANIATQNGQVVLNANKDITVQNDTTRHSTVDESYSKSGNLLSTTTTVRADSTTLTQVEGSNISGKSVLLQSGVDTTVQGSAVKAAEDLQILAGRDTNIISAQQRSSSSNFYQSSTSPTAFGSLIGIPLAIAMGPQFAGPLITRKSEMQDGDHVNNQAIGSTLSGRNVGIDSGRDATIQGSTIVADKDVDIYALRNINLVSAQNTLSDRTSSSSKTSGAIGTFLQPAFGTVKQSQNGEVQSTSQTGSQVASLGTNGTGNVTFNAGSQYTQTASNVLAQAGDINVRAKSVVINEAYNTSNNTQHQEYSKVALGGSVSVPLLNAVQGMVGMAQAAKASGDGRMQALAAINAGMQAKSAYDSIQSMGSGNFGGIKVSVSIGSSKSESNSTQTASAVVGSNLAAAGNINIEATGAGQDSNLTATAADIRAGNNVSLKADNQVTLQAAQSTLTDKSSNSASGASIGIGFAIGGSQNGFTLDIGANKSRGNADGTDVVNTNTHVTAGNIATIQSGGDTNLKGATVAGRQVIADVGGNLNIESLQDTSVYDSKQVSGGFGVSLCIPPFCYGASSVSGSISNSKAKGDYASVTEQSGIQAGDGGFDVKVAGNTDLKGGAIASSQVAVDANKNSFTTGTLTQSDLQNRDSHEAESVSLSGSFSGKLGDQSTAVKPADVRAANAKVESGAGAGIGKDSGNQSSITRSGISGGVIAITDDAGQQQKAGKSGNETIASLNRDIVSGQNDGALTKDWNGQQMLDKVAAQAAITQAFLPMAAKAVGDFAEGQLNAAKKLRAQAANEQNDPGKRDELLKQANEIESNWKEGGFARVLAHTAVGALGGGVNGALGAAASAGAADLMNDLKTNLQQALVDGGVSSETAGTIAQGIAGLTATGIGAAVGGTAGATTAFNTDFNNRMLHDKEKTKLYELQKGKSPAEQQRLADAACALTHCSLNVSDSDPLKAAAVEQEKRGATYLVEQEKLKKTGLFDYDNFDLIMDMELRTVSRAGLELQSAGRGARNMLYQILTHGPGGNVQAPPSDPYEMGGPNGPTTGGSGAMVMLPVAVCIPPFCVFAPVIAPGTPGYVPSNALLSGGQGSGSGSGSGGDDNATTRPTSTSEGTANAATGPKLADNLASNMSKPVVSDTKLGGLMDDLYRDGAKIGTGSTADAVRYETATGNSVGGVFHTQKAQDYSVALQKWLDSNPVASFSDRSAAQNVLRDLQNALKGK